MRAIRKRIGMIAVVALAGAGTMGCTMSETGQRTVSGGLMGAAGGAALGAIGGNAALGAAAGAAAGVVGGFLYDQHKQAEEAAYERGRSGR
jgi:hypothetical protein